MSVLLYQIRNKSIMSGLFESTAIKEVQFIAAIRKYLSALGSIAVMLFNRISDLKDP